MSAILPYMSAYHRGSLALVTAFEPWADFDLNSSWEAVRLLKGHTRIRIARLPVDHERAAQALQEALLDLEPHVCLCCGMAAGAPRPRLERWVRRPGHVDRAEGPDVLAAHWPIGEPLRLFANEGLRLVSFDDPGDFVCGTTMWALLNFRRRHGWPRWAGFLHVPSVGDACPRRRWPRPFELWWRTGFAGPRPARATRPAVGS